MLFGDCMGSQHVGSTLKRQHFPFDDARCDLNIVAGDVSIPSCSIAMTVLSLLPKLHLERFPLSTGQKLTK